MPQNRKLQNLVENKYMADNAIGTAELLNDAVTDAKTSSTIEKTLVFLYDGISQTASAKTLTHRDGVTAQTLPAGAIVKSFYIDSTTAFTSDGSATLALGWTGAAAAIMAATAFDNAAIAIATAGWTNSATAAGATGGLGGAKSVLLTIGTAAITAGDCYVYITYIEA